ncbi:hypothetical protein G195_000971 [Phytophthora kernoviae 00238/432]|uniref:6-phosphofructokinase n=1 Tax=Phytophthora kernoviae 00238/432 TaxID=1284355 RepID=A0A8J4SCS1_9STRA|nr:hypothetical protein G195_000971 [Phytophthora kernoviae 00238/432]
MLDAVDPEATPVNYYALREEQDDGGYLRNLVTSCQELTRQLPGYASAKPQIQDLAGLYTDLQVYKHIKPELRETALLEWWSEHRHRTPQFRWNEFAAATGSTLGVFMLFLAASDDQLTEEQAASIHTAYFPHVCALHIMLDYLIDQDEDRIGGDLNFCNYYENVETMLDRIAFIVEMARSDVEKIPGSSFHRMIIEGLLAIYLSDPKVSEQQEVRVVSKRLMKNRDIIQRGGTVLQSARCKEFYTAEGQQKGADILRARGIDGLVVIGGDGSYNGANKLSKLGINTMGLPGTIDNDVSFTDYTIGFDTAVSIVVDAVNKLRDTMSSHERSSIVEVMGRHCGDIALHAGLASGAETILVPEVPFDMDEVADRMKANFAHGKRHSIIIVAEGVGKGEDVAKELMERCPTYEPRVTVLGHIQRGGTPTPFDRNLASRLGDFAVRSLIAGETDKGCGIIKGELTLTDIDKVVNTKKDFDMETYELAQRLSQ